MQSGPGNGNLSLMEDRCLARPTEICLAFPEAGRTTMGRLAALVKAAPG